MSTQQQIQNCETFLKNWANIKPKQVSKNLSRWNEDFRVGENLDVATYKHSCNTIACAGGWLSSMPEFQEMGVILDPHAGEPVLVDSEGSAYDCDDMQEVLFGAEIRMESLFEYRDYSEIGTDHEVVTKRFEAQIAKLKEKSNEHTTADSEL